MRLRSLQLGSFLLAALLGHSYYGAAQDEGTISKKARFEKASSLYLQVAPGLAFGSNSGDYRGGFQVEIGLISRKNSILSFGPTFSYQRFGYKSDYSNSFQKSNARGTNTFFEEGGYEVAIIFPDGGDVQLIALGAKLTAFMVPPAEGKGATLFVIASPKIIYATRAEMTSNSESWYVDTIPPGNSSNWGFNQSVFVSSATPGRSGWAKESTVAGGIDLGLGSHVPLGNGFQLQLSGVLGTNFGVPHIHTKNYRPTLASYNDSKFPFSTKAFTSFSLGVGISYTF